MPQAKRKSLHAGKFSGPRTPPTRCHRFHNMAPLLRQSPFELSSSHKQRTSQRSPEDSVKGNTSHVPTRASFPPTGIFGHPAARTTQHAVFMTNLAPFLLRTPKPVTTFLRDDCTDGPRLGNRKGLNGSNQTPLSNSATLFLCHTCAQPSWSDAS